MMVATALVATQDLVTKQLTGLLPVSQIVAIRFAAMAAFVIWYYGRRQPVHSLFASASPARQVVRCLLACAEIAMFTFALRFLGLAEIHVIFACFPLIATALSPLLLRETVGWRRWLAVGVGFVGTVIILQPGSGIFDWSALLGLACAVLYALYNVMTRQVGQHDSVAISTMYLAITGLAASVVFAAMHWQPVSTAALCYLLAVCIISIGAHMLLIKALVLCPAVVLQPFNYLILVWAAALAFVVYGEMLQSAQVAGVVLVVASGIYIGWREYRYAGRVGNVQTLS